ncbi:MAG: uS2 family ribosomal protein, partial [Bacteroidales bacterium]|nr:uS2 family ribosomal protein [Bacteroidales bacterium]
KLNIPTFAIVDTNSNPNEVDFPIPANDDASKSIQLIVSTMIQAIQEGLAERKLDKDKMEEDEREMDDDNEDNDLDVDIDLDEDDEEKKAKALKKSKKNEDAEGEDTMSKTKGPRGAAGAKKPAARKPMKK